MSISSGIMLFSCVILLAYRGLCSRSRFSFSGSAPMLVPCPLGRCHRRCHHDVIGLGGVACLPLGDASRRPRFAFLLSAPRRLVSSPRLFVSGDGEPAGLLACLDGVMPTAAGAYRALDAMPCSWSICRVSVVLSALLLRIGWRRGRERLRCDMAVAAACPMM